MVTLASDWQELRTPSSSHTQFLCMLQAAPATPALPSTASMDRKVSDAPPALQLPGSHAHPKSHIMMQSESQNCYYRMHSLHTDCANISRAKGTDNESAHMEQTIFPEFCGDSRTTRIMSLCRQPSAAQAHLVGSAALPFIPHTRETSLTTLQRQRGTSRFTVTAQPSPSSFLQ